MWKGLTSWWVRQESSKLAVDENGECPRFCVLMLGYRSIILQKSILNLVGGQLQRGVTYDRENLLTIR